MATFDTRDFITRFLAALASRNRVQLAQLLHEDFVTELRQSGERTTGIDAFLAELQQYPDGGPQMPAEADLHLLPNEERWAISPGYTVVPLASPSDFTVKFKVRYPDGRWWHVVGLLELRGEKLYRMENYFAPEMPAPLAESIAAYQHG